MHPNRIITLASVAVGVAIIVTAGFILLGMNRSETSPEIASPAQPAPPSVIATITTHVDTTPTPVPPPPPAVIVVTPVPTPVATEAEAAARDVLAPWVYYFPTKWVPDAAEWPESYRWQPPLPTLEPPPGWKHNTWRTPYPTFEGRSDRPFIRAYDRPYGETLPRQVESDMHAIFAAHQQVLVEWAVMQETLEMDGIDPYITGVLEEWLRDLALPGLRSQGVGLQVSPHVHEIIAMTIFGDHAEVLQVYRNGVGIYFDMETGERRFGPPAWDAVREDNISYTYAQWQRIDGRWTEASATFSADSTLSPVEWLAERSPPLVPYITLWEAAFTQESVARDGTR